MPHSAGRRANTAAKFIAATGAALAALVGCVAQPVDQAPVGPPDTTVYFYPLQGQSSAQQDRDRYECHTWAVRQSGFDPSVATVPPHLRSTVVIGPPPGTGVATGAMTGAVLGAAVSNPWESGSGALLGALAGAVIGGIAESTARAQAAADSAVSEHAAALERQAGYYRRAMSACLEGRGYRVE